MKKIIIIGAGMGGMAAGIFGRLNGFETTIFEAHSLPGGQCTSWNRKGYIFDPTMHNLNGFKPGTKIYRFWEELGVIPCETIARKEFVSAVLQDGTAFHSYFDVEKLESHMMELSPEDASVIHEFIRAIKSLVFEYDWFGISNLGSFWEKLSLLPFMLPKLQYFKYTLGSYAMRFRHPLLRKAFPFLRYSAPETPLFGYLAEHAHCTTGDILWPRGGGMTVSNNMASYFERLGGIIQYRKKVVRILTENDSACGVELEDGTIHKADYVISNADGRKTLLEMLGGYYLGKKMKRYCKPFSDTRALASSVLVFLGVKRDLSQYPSSVIQFLDHSEIIAGQTCDHLQVQLYGFDTSMAPKGKGVIKAELFAAPSYFSKMREAPSAYAAEKNNIAERVIALLEGRFPGLRDDVEIIDVSTLHTWERYMGGTQGFNNFPRKYEELTDIRNVLDFLFGLNKTFQIPDLKNFYFTGQWVTSMGSLFSNALTGRTVIQKICKHSGVAFTTSGMASEIETKEMERR